MFRVKGTYISGQLVSGWGGFTSDRSFVEWPRLAVEIRTVNEGQTGSFL